MYNPRNYHCKACGKSFTASDGVISLPSSGVKCPYCGSNKTSESRGSLKFFVREEIQSLSEVFRLKKAKFLSGDKLFVEHLKNLFL